MKIQKSKKIKRFAAFLLSFIMTATAIPAFELSSFAEESSELTIEQPALLADEKGITREEWIHELVTIFDMSVDDESTMQKYFTDTASSKYSKDIDLAANYGVFDIYDTKFNPKEYVTREFAAHTANYCIGYFDDGTSVSLKDKNKIYYEYDSIVSVQKNWFALSDGNFNPNSYMTDTEAKKILDDAKESLNSIKIDENAKNTITYADSVIQIEDTAKATYYDGTVTISDTKAELSAGDIFTVNIDNFAHLYKAEKVTKGLNNKLIITTAEADIDSALEKVDIQGIGQIDYDNIKYYNTAPSEKMYSAGDGAVYMRSPEYLASKDFVPVNINTDIGGVKVTITGSINNIVPKYRVVKDGKGGLDEFYLEASADASLQATLNDKINKEIKIADVPVLTYINTYGLVKANLTLSAIISISGEIKLSYSWGLNGGISYKKNGGWRATKDFQKKGFTLDVKVDQSLAVKANLSAEILFGAAKGNIYLIGGEKGTAYGTERNDKVSCTTIKAHVFAEVGVNFKVVGIEVFNKTYPFINEANSPLKINLHFENDKLVPKCTYGDDGSSSGTNPSKSLSPVKYSEYGTYFGDLISYENSADYKPNQIWEKEDVTLSEDVTINGDLYVNKELDLNGHTLNVTGNFTIGKNGYIRMYSKFSILNVKGDFITESKQKCYHENVAYYNCYTDGTIMVGGDLTAKNADYDNFSLEGTELIFTGNNPHTIYSLNSDTDIDNFSVENDMQLKFKGKFGSISLSSDISIIDEMSYCNWIYINGYKLNVDGDFNQSGSINIKGGTTNSCELNINGDLISSGGRLSVDTGTVNVSGDCKISSVSLSNGVINIDGNLDTLSSGDFNIGQDSIVNIRKDFSLSYELYLRGLMNVNGNFKIEKSGYIKMPDKSSTLKISGDFITESSSKLTYNYNYLNAGVVELKGSLYQKNAAVDNLSFSHEGTELKLIGKGTHIISILNIDTYVLGLTLSEGASVSLTGNFNGLSNIENYTINLEDESIASANKNIITPLRNGNTTVVLGNNSYNSFKLSVEEIPEENITILGDLNNDNEINVSDIVVLQKFILKQNNNISKLADLNGDGRIDVFDMILLRRLILKSV